MKRYCRNPQCSKPLGSTDKLCHECGGRSFRGRRRGVSFGPMPFLPGVRAAMSGLFARRGGDRE